MCLTRSIRKDIIMVKSIDAAGSSNQSGRKCHLNLANLENYVKADVARKIREFFQGKDYAADANVDLSDFDTDGDLSSMSKSDWKALGLDLKRSDMKALNNALFQSEVEKFEDGTFIEKFYDSDGNLVKTSRKIDDSNTLVTEYNSDGKILREANLDSHGNCSYEDTYEYDKEGKLMKQTQKATYGNGGTATAEYTEHDENGNPLKGIISWDTGSSPYVREYVYDENGNRIKNIQKTMEGNIYDVTEYEYDENGNRTKLIKKDDDGNVTREVVYEYDDDGHVLREIQNEYGTTTGKIFYSNGQIKETYYKDEWGSDGMTMYDPQGHRTVHIGPSFDGFEKTTYEYDSEGNLIDQKTEPFTGTVDEDGNIIDDDTP